MSTLTVAEIMSWESYMPSLRSADKPLLSEQDGWAIYTSPDYNRSGREANMLVHLACDRHYPNWWLGGTVLKTTNPMLQCNECDKMMTPETYKLFWSTYRILNMRNMNAQL